MKNSFNKLLNTAIVLVANLASSGATLFGYKDQVFFLRTLGGSVQGLFSFTYNSKLHAIAMANDGAGNYFLFIPKSVLISTYGMPSAYVQGFEETADAGLTLEAQSSSYTTGVRRVTNISSTDAQNAIGTLNALSNGQRILPTTDGYFFSSNGALPPATALPITTATGTVPDKRIVSSDDPKDPKAADKAKTWLQKNWGWVVGGLAVAVVIFVIARNR